MTRTANYDDLLRRLPEAQWDAWLVAHSALPGPRANLELMAAAAGSAARQQLLDWVGRAGDLDVAGDDPREFLVCCGTVGLGRLLAGEDEDPLWARLWHLAGHSRWRVREAVAMALQRVGRQDMARLLVRMRHWSAGPPLVRRAAVAGVCEPALLRDPGSARHVLDLLDAVTGGLTREPDRRTVEMRVLRQTLSYAWSVAVAALPAEGRPRLERWSGDPDDDVRAIVRNNLKKKRLQRLDPAWVAKLAAQLAPPPRQHSGGPGDPAR